MSAVLRPRPAWVEQFNRLGAAHGDPRALVPLDAESLLDAARRATGLDDFGDGHWREGFDVLVGSIEDEGRLHLLGRLLSRDEIVRALVNRLRVTAWRTEHPEIDGERIDAPVLVVGTGRSGTSILHELLAQDPRHRVGLTWELLHPCPPPEPATYATDPRIAIAEHEMTYWNDIAPEYRTMHENGGAVPNEDLFLDTMEFASDHFMGSYPTPAYGKWLARKDLAPVFAAHRRSLQFLQSGGVRGRWVLKSPSYLSKLPAFFAEYPDATVIITHRDPLRVLPSMTSLMATLKWMRTDHVDAGAIAGMVGHGNAIVFDLIDRWRTDGTLPDSQIVDVRYADLIADPSATLRSVYERIGTSYDEPVDAAVRAYLAAKPQARHGAHEYSMADTGLDAAEMRARYSGYLQRYGIPEEV